MQTIEYHGWEGCIRLANDAIEVVASTSFGPRIMRLAFTSSGSNVLREIEEWQGKIGPADKWVNYGGHRVWHAPEVMPRTYAPDNSPVRQAVMDGPALLLLQEVEKTTGIGKELRIQLGRRDMPVVKVDHVLTNHNPWSIELAPWSLSVVAAHGRVILPQEPFRGHGEGNDFLPVRPLVLWPFTDMADTRWKWGTHFIQLKSDAAKDNPQKIGIFNRQGWGAYHSSQGDLFLKFVDVEDMEPEEYPDMGSNFEIFTKGDFQELETLAPTQLLDPGEQAIHREYWVLLKKPDLPEGDAALAEALPSILQDASTLIERMKSMN